MQSESNIQSSGSIEDYCVLHLHYISMPPLQGAMPTDTSIWMTGNSLY